MVRYSADIIAVVDGTGRLIEASPAAVEVLDLDPDDLVGRSMFDLIHPEDRAPVAKALARRRCRPRRPGADHAAGAGPGPASGATWKSRGTSPRAEVAAAVMSSWSPAT